MSAAVHVPPPLVCEPLSDLLSRFGGERGNAPHFIARLPGGRVFGPGNVLAPDGRSLARDVSADYGKPFHEHWLLTYEKMRPPVYVAGETAVVAVTLGHRYSHWLLEELPRWLALRTENPDAIIAHTRAPFIREALELGGFPFTKIREAGRYSHFECEQLLVPVSMDALKKNTAQSLGLLTEFTAPLRKARSALGERLYVSREHATRRRVSNELDLWRMLEARGFRKLIAEHLSWAAQVEAFSQAKVVVGPHGAGLANNAFCEPGTRVVELFNRAYVNPCYEHLAVSAKLDYRAVVESGGGDARGSFEPTANRDDIRAAIPAIIDALIDS